MTVRLPKPLFKYTRHKYADAMTRRGEFRIGTLHEFRRVETHGPEIGDPGEGTKQVVDNVSGHWRDVTSRPNLAQTFISAPADADIRFENVGFQLNHDVPDMFVYCVTAVQDDQAMQAFGADDCVAITNPSKFFRALDTSLRAMKLVGALTVAPCYYGDRRRDVATDGALHPALIKPVRYAYQREVRALWEPRDLPIEPVIVYGLPAARYLERRRPTGCWKGS